MRATDGSARTADDTKTTDAEPTTTAIVDTAEPRWAPTTASTAIASPTTMRAVVLGGLMAALAAGGCTSLLPSSAPVRYYAIAPLATQQPAARCAVRFGVRSVSVPGYVDRDEILVAREGTQLAISSRDLWAAPLRVELSRTLGESISARWAGSRFVPFPWHFGETPPWALEVSFEELDPVGGELAVRARWSLASTGELREPAAAPNVTTGSAAAGPASTAALGSGAAVGDGRAALPREIAASRLDTRVPRTANTAAGTADAIARAAAALADQIATQGRQALAAREPDCR